jgi:hypothetical protein
MDDLAFHRRSDRSTARMPLLELNPKRKDRAAGKKFRIFG